MSSSTFDAYYKWLGIPPAEQPPNHYRLLGINLFESDPDVVQAASDQRMIHLRSFQTGQHSALSQKLLNETAAAKLCLLKPDRKAQYDAGLREQLAMRAPPAAPGMSVPPPIPTAGSPVSNPVAADFADVDAVTATARIAAQETPWQPDPLDFMNSQPVYSKTVGVSSAKSKMPLVLLIAAPILGIGIVIAAIKIFNDREEADNRRLQDSSVTSRTDKDNRPSFSSDSRPTPTGNELKPPLLVLDWPKEDRDGGFVILDEMTDDVSKRTGALEYELKPGELKTVRLRRVGSAPIDFTVPPKNPGERFTCKPLWQPLEPDGEATKIATHEHQAIPPIPDNPLDKPPLDRNPLDTKPPDKMPRRGDKSLATRDNNSKPALGRVPVPDEAAREKALAQLKEVMKDEFAKAKGPEAQLALAGRLAQLAQQETEKDPPMGYVAADQALEIAVRQCDIGLASQLVGGFASHFDVDAWKLKSTTLNQLGHAAKNVDQRASLAKAALEQIDKAIADDRLEIAVELAATATFLSASLKDLAVRDVAKEAAERTKRIQKGAQDAKAAGEALLTNPKDPEANLTLGKFKCFLKDDWKFGVPLLALGDDEDLRKLAATETADPTDSADQVKLADQWWDLAETKTADKSEAGKKDEWTVKPMRSRAVYWYRRALPSLSGLALTKAQKRIDEAGPAASETAVIETAFLDDLAEQGVSVGNGSLGKHGDAGYFPPGKVKVRGVKPLHAVSMHPPTNGSSTVSYNLDGKYRTFSGTAAIMDDAKQMQSKAVFRVYGDGKQLWTSRPLRASSEFQECNVRITGVQTLKLEVVCTGQLTGTHAVWVAPMLTK
jgi:hypothetical protein